MRRLALVLVVIAAACSKDASNAGSSTSAASGSAPEPAYAPLGKKPADSRRPTPPPGIEAGALALGAKAPPVELADPSGATWTLADALAKHARVMFVFNRGDW
jgi:hypothetical protein